MPGGKLGRSSGRPPRPRPPGPPGPPPSSSSPSFMSCGQHVHAALRVEIDVVVAGARPVAVGVDQRDVEGKELQRAVDVEQRRQLRFKAVGGRLD